MYTLQLTGEQVEAVRVALESELVARKVYAGASRTSFPADTPALAAAANAIAEQWHALHVAQRDAALKEGTS